MRPDAIELAVAQLCAMDHAEFLAAQERKADLSAAIEHAAMAGVPTIYLLEAMGG